MSEELYQKVKSLLDNTKSDYPDLILSHDPEYVADDLLTYADYDFEHQSLDSISLLVARYMKENVPFYVGSKVMFHDENQCEIRGTVVKREELEDKLILTVDMGESYFTAHLYKETLQ